MDLHKHLVKLVCENDKVVIPGFGYFQCDPLEANIHPVEHRFSPASKTIRFHVSKETRGDELLNSLMKDGRSSQEAKAEIDAFTRKAIQELKAGKKFQFKEIGFLYVQTGNWIFEQDQKLSFSKEHFGLPSFVHKPVKSAAEPVQTPKAPVQKERKSRKALWISLAAIALLLAASAVVFMKWGEIQTYLAESASEKPTQVALSDDHTDTLSADPLIAETIESDTTSNDSTQVLDTLMTDTTDTDVDVIDDEAVPKRTDTPVQTSGSNGIYQEMKYFLVAGCFREEVRADEFLQELLAEGYKASREGTTSGGLHRVVYGGYNTWADAKADLQIVKEKGREGAWIQKNK